MAPARRWTVISALGVIQILTWGSSFYTLLQNGSRLPAGRYESLSGSLSGVSEFRMPHDGDTYRCYQFVER